MSLLNRAITNGEREEKQRETRMNHIRCSYEKGLLTFIFPNKMAQTETNCDS